MNAQASPLSAHGLTIRGSQATPSSEILTPPVQQLLVQLHRDFDARRLQLLEERNQRQRRFDAGELPDFLSATRAIREDASWRVAAVPADLRDRRVEITGPVDRKMIINALNAPVQVFMADFEDSTAPTWDNLIRGQINLRDAVGRTIDFTELASGKRYALGAHPATLIVRPRGWHLPEKHVLVDGQELSGALFDFAVYLVTNHEALRRLGTGPYFYLPKLESHREARLWNDVFLAAQQQLGLPPGTIKATVLIETLPAAFEMEEILHELREHVVGLNCGRWDYIFSFIKKLRSRADGVLPDRASVTMDCHFLRSYVELLIRTCHKRGAHAMGGMAAQIPSRDDALANEAAMAKVLADKQREVAAGHDGTWIAHPGLAAVAYQAFDDRHAPNQLQVTRADVQVTAADLLRIPPGLITRAGVRHNIRVGLQYLAAWLEGTGCVPLYHLMEDAATAEICRAQLWQWLHHGARLDDGAQVSESLIDTLLAEELDGIRRSVGRQRYAAGSFSTAARLFGYLITKPDFDDFLTLPAYEFLP
jgi:malate synthase